jgi:hypothetical protein
MWDTNKHTENKKVASTIILAPSEICEQAYYKWVALKKILDAKDRHDQTYSKQISGLNEHFGRQEE